MNAAPLVIPLATWTARPGSPDHTDSPSPNSVAKRVASASRAAEGRDGAECVLVEGRHAGTVDPKHRRLVEESGWLGLLVPASDAVEAISGIGFNPARITLSPFLKVPSRRWTSTARLLRGTSSCAVQEQYYAATF